MEDSWQFRQSSLILRKKVFIIIKPLQISLESQSRIKGHWMILKRCSIRLILENCTFGPDCDRTFEYSTLQADIHGAITNIKNPMSGCIVADEFGSITIDENIKAPADCEIRLRDERTCFTD